MNCLVITARFLDLIGEFEKLMEIATQKDMFMFDGKLYKQTDGVTKGFPLGPVLSNLFLCHQEKLWLE